MKLITVISTFKKRLGSIGVLELTLLFWGVWEAINMDLLGNVYVIAVLTLFTLDVLRRLFQPK